MCEDTPPGSFTCSCPTGTVMNGEGTCVGMYHTQYVQCKCYMYMYESLDHVIVGTLYSPITCKYWNFTTSNINKCTACTT